MILSKPNQLPDGVEVEIVSIPKGSDWSTCPWLVGLKGKMETKLPDRITIILDERGRKIHTSGRINCHPNHPLEVRILNDPDGNY